MENTMPAQSTLWDTIMELDREALSRAGDTVEPTDLVGSMVPNIRAQFPGAKVSYSHANRGRCLRIYVTPTEGSPFTLPASRSVVYACKYYPTNA